MPLNNRSLKKSEIKIYIGKKWQQEYDNPKAVECSKISSKKKVYSNKILPQERKKKISNNLILHLK